MSTTSDPGRRTRLRRSARRRTRAPAVRPARSCSGRSWTASASSTRGRSCEPGDLRRRGRLRRRDDPDRRRHRQRRADRVRHRDRDRAVVHGPVRELRRGDGRRAAARRRPRPCGGPAPTWSRDASLPDGSEETVPASRAARRRPRDGVGRRADPGRRRDRRGHRLGRRVGDHRRVGAR